MGFIYMADVFPEINDCQSSGEAVSVDTGGQTQVGGKRMFFKSTGLLAVTLLLSGMASSAWTAEMVIDPNSQLYLIGKIVPGDFERFKSALRTAPAGLNTINLRSPGGDVMEAVKIGRLVRSLYLDTLAPLSPEAGPYAKHNCSSDHPTVRRQGTCLCASACFLIWAGGLTPFGDHVYIHRISFDKEYYGSLSPSEADIKYEQGLRVVREYLTEMGVPERYYEKLVRTPSNFSAKVKFLEVMKDFNWIGRPSLNEWMIARCGGWGHPDISKRYKIQNCWSAELAKVRELAMEKFKKERPEPQMRHE
jgi:hypothetical protein